MKKFSLLFCIILGLTLQNAKATAPTTPTSNLVYSNIQGDRMTLTWTNGNGASRIVIAKAGSAVTFTPVNGKSYARYSSVASGESVVYNGTGNTFTFSTMGSGNLSIGTTYYFKIIEFNGSGTTTEYITSALTGYKATLSMATEPTQAVPSAYVAWRAQEIYNGSPRQKIGLAWSPGNGERTMIIAKAGSAVDPSVIPTDGTTSYQWKTLANGHFICYYGTGTTFEFKSDGIGNLLPSTTYYFLFVTLNGDKVVSNYLASSYKTLSGTTLANAPTTGSTNLTFTNVQTNQMTLNWTSGNGAGRIIIAKKGSAPTTVPSDGTTYAVNSTPASGEVVVYNGTSNTYTLNSSTALGSITNNTTYYFAIYEYTGSGTTTAYYSPALSGNQTTLSIASEPTAASSGLSFTNVQTNQMTLNWTNGNGAQRIIIARAGSPVTVTPTDGVGYALNTSISSGQVVVYSGSSNTYTLNSSTGLGTIQPNTTYYFAIFEFNGSGSSSNYLTSTFLSGNQTTTSLAAEPTTAASGLNFTNVQTNQMTLNWTSGNGSNRLIIARAGSPVTVSPTDGVSYSLNTSISSGQVVIYNGTSNTYTLNGSTGLGTIQANTTYYFAIYEFNGSGNSTNYLTSSFLSGSQTTLSNPTKPTVPASNLTFTNVQTNKMTLNWTSGDGAKRLIVARSGSPVSFVPVDGVGYSSYQSLGSGNFVLTNSSGSTYTFSNDGYGALPAGTTYYFAIFEFNGSGSSTMYLTSSYLTGNQSTLPSGGRFGSEDGSSATFIAYPNPASQFINIEFSNTNNNQSLAIINSTGATVFEQAIGSHEQQLYLDLSAYPKGLYYVTMKSNEAVIEQQKVVVY